MAEMRYTRIIRKTLLLSAIGIILSLSIASMCCSGTWNLNKFYDVGEVFDTWNLNDEPAISCNLPSKKINWNYLYLHASDVGDSPLSVRVVFYDKLWNWLKEGVWELSDGENEIPLNQIGLEGLKYKKVAIVNLEGQEAPCKVYRAQFREFPEYFSWRRFAVVFFLILAAYGLVVLFVCKKLGAKEKLGTSRGVMDLALENAQRVYWKVFEGIPERVQRIPEYRKNAYRVECLVFLFLNSLMMAKFGNYQNRLQYQGYMVLQSALLIIWCMVSLKPGQKLCHFNKKFLAAWGSMCILMCISDFIVDKKFAHTGIWMLFTFSIVFWGWANVDDPKKIFKELEKAVEVIFLVFCLYCFLFEPYDGVSGYIGMTTNQNTLGEFMTVALAAFCSMLDELFYHKNNHKNIFFKTLEVLMAGYLLFISTCRASLVFVVLCFILFSAKIRMNLQNRQYRKNVLMFCAMLAVVSLPFFKIADWGIKNIPRIFKTDISTNFRVAGGQELFAEDGSCIVYAKKSQEGVTERIKRQKEFAIQYYKVDNWTNYRVSIWQTYIEHLNLWGHFGNEMVYAPSGNIKIGTHNMFLTILYQYGVFALIPYLASVCLMVSYGIRYVVRKGKEPGVHAFLPLGLAVAYIISASLGNIEQPMRYIPWIVFYFLMGFCATNHGD